MTNYTMLCMHIYCKKGNVIMTDSFYFRFRWVNTIHYYYVENTWMRKRLSCMTIFSSFSAKFPPHYHTTILAISCAMHQIGSFICNEHDKLMVKMTILFLLCACRLTTIYTHNDACATKCYVVLEKSYMLFYQPSSHNPESMVNRASWYTHVCSAYFSGRKICSLNNTWVNVALF